MTHGGSGLGLVGWLGFFWVWRVPVLGPLLYRFLKQRPSEIGPPVVYPSPSSPSLRSHSPSPAFSLALPRFLSLPVSLLDNFSLKLSLSLFFSSLVVVRKEEKKEEKWERIIKRKRIAHFQRLGRKQGKERVRRKEKRKRREKVERKLSNLNWVVRILLKEKWV